MSKKELRYPTGSRLAAFTAQHFAQHWRRSADQLQPELEYAKRDAIWWIIPRHKSVLIGTADGSGKSWYRHDQRKFRRLWRESQWLTRQIERNWDELSRRYREALPEITSPEAWRKAFGSDGDKQ